MKVHGVCRLTKDVRVIRFSSGAKVAKLALAWDKRRVTENGVVEKSSQYLDADLFQSGRSAQADNAARFLKKGSKVYVSGRLEYQTFETSSGRETKHVLIVEDIEYLDPKPKPVAAGADEPGDETGVV